MPMIDGVFKLARRSCVPLLAIFLYAALACNAWAQSSLGIGSSEATVPTGGLFGGFMQWINLHQQGFYRALTGALKSMRQDRAGTLVLIGLSFAYGVFHAAGPGHGKAVISSYMLANEVALRRGLLLAFVSAGLQAVSAIALMGAVFLLLRGGSVSMTDATRVLETASYALVAAFGAWLLWRKARPLLAAAPALSLSAAASSSSHAEEPAGHIHHAHCSSCGHAHAPDPALLTEDRFSWRSASAAVAAVGLRPCSGALIVLAFSFLNGLWLAGIASVFAMALGTAVTVAGLAIMAVTTKNWAVRLAGDRPGRMRIHHAIELAGAALVLVLGLTLLSASLTA